MDHKDIKLPSKKNIKKQPPEVSQHDARNSLSKTTPAAAASTVQQATTINTNGCAAETEAPVHNNNNIRHEDVAGSFISSARATAPKKKGSVTSKHNNLHGGSPAITGTLEPPSFIKENNAVNTGHRGSVDSRVELRSFPGDSISLASRTSRSSRFMRTVSTRKTKAAAWLSAKLRKHQKGMDLSATFNLLDQEDKGVSVNLNTATEEELMTVEGITRPMAHSIVDHRTKIGCFKQLQDLALVSGIGASKLATFSRDLTVKQPSTNGDSSSPSPDGGLLSPTTYSPPLTLHSSSPHSKQLSAHTISPTSSHVSTPHQTSLFSSPTPSHPSTPHHHQQLTARSSSCSSPAAVAMSHSSSSPLRRVNLNTASIFELMTVPGINQEMAAHIVHYREKKGSFKSVEEVTRVRGMRAKLTRHLHPHLTVGCNGASATTADASGVIVASPSLSSSTAAVSCTPKNFVSSCIKSDAKAGAPAKQLLKIRQGHRRTLSAPLNHNAQNRLTSPNVVIQTTLEDDQENITLIETTLDSTKYLESPVKSSHRLSMEFSSDVYELLSLRSERPEIHSLFENSHAGRSAIRIATWNLCKLTHDKISNPGVMEVLCRTILERGFSVVAVQDLLASNVLEKVANELNAGSLRRVREWPGKRGKWAFVQSKEPVTTYALYKSMRKSCNEYVGYLYNQRFVELDEEYILDCNVNHSFVSKPYIAKFKANSLSFIMVNLHVKKQKLIYRSESLLQASTDLLDPFTQPGYENGVPPEEEDPNATVGETFDEIKSTKNLQNGLIKENLLGREEISLGSSRASVSSEGKNRSSLTDGSGSIHTINGYSGGTSGPVAAFRNSYRRHLSTDSTICLVEDELKSVIDKLKDKHKKEKSVIVLGDFSVSPDNEGMSGLSSCGYRHVLCEEESTVLSSGGRSPSVPYNSDNIWLTAPLYALSTGEHCVVKEGLSHLAIPRGWGWGGLATTHCPIYADLYTDTSLQ